MTDPTQDEGYMQDVEESLYGEGGGGGKGGGGGSTRVAKEAPNTLQSNNVAKIIDILGEGPIKGLVGGLKGIYFDQTPLQNSDNSFNFDGVKITTRSGTPSQSYIPGFPTVQSEVDVSTQLEYGDPVTRSINNLSADAAYVKIQVPALTLQNRENGDLKGNEVDVRVRVEDTNGANAYVKVVSIKGKTVSPYQRQVRVALNGPGPWTLQLERLSQDDEGSHSRSETYWATYTEVIDAKLAYPDSALVAVEVNAQDFGTSVPQRAYHVEGLIVSVPSNYNPTARTYSGIWDGTFKQAYTNNPAWIFYDIATRVRYGAKLKNIDKWALYTIGQYCDEEVDDGFGGMEPRFTINTVIETRRQAYKVLDEIASTFRGMVYWASDSIMPVADMPVDSVYKRFGPADIEGDFEYSGTALRARHTAVLVTYNDPRDFHRKSVEVVENSEMIQRHGWKQKDVVAFGCTSRGQAVRVGKWILDSEEHETDTVSFVGGTEAYDLRPGHVIAISDPNIAGARLMGRIVTPGTTQLELDAVPDSVSGLNWFIDVVMPDYSTYTREITTFQGNVVTLNAALPEEPMDSAVWVLKSADVNPRQFRVLSVNEKDGLKYAVSCLEHDPTKYARVEEGVYLEPDGDSLIPTGPIAPPDNLAVEVYKYLSGGAENQGLAISWTGSEDRRVVQYLLEAQGPQEPAYRQVYLGGDLTADMRNTDPGEWSFRVRAIDARGRTSPWVYYQYNAAGLLLPLPPTSVDIIPGPLHIQLIPRGRVSGTTFEYWRSNAALATAQIESNAVQVGEGNSLSDQGLKLDTLYFYYIRGVNAHGVSNWYPVQASTNADISAVLDALEDEITSSHLVASITSEIDKIPSILTDLDAAQAAIQTETDTRISEDNALAQSITDIQGQWNDDITAAIQDERTAWTDADSALATDITTLQSTLGDEIASVETKAQTALDAADDSWKSMYTVKLNVNGHVSGFGTYNDGQTSSFVIVADEFALVDPSGGNGNYSTPFIVRDGAAYLRNAYIYDAAINNAKIENGAINNAKIANGSISNAKIQNAAINTLKLQNQAVTFPLAATAKARGYISTTLSHRVNVSGNFSGAPVLINFGGSVQVKGSFSSSSEYDCYVNMEIQRDGNTIFDSSAGFGGIATAIGMAITGKGGVGAAVAGAIIDTPPAGNHNYRMMVRSSFWGSADGQNYHISTLELKK